MKTINISTIVCTLALTVLVSTAANCMAGNNGGHNQLSAWLSM